MSANIKYGVNISGAVNASGTVTVNGSSTGNIGVLLDNSSLTLSGGQGETIVGTSNTGLYGVYFGSNGTLIANHQLTINGTGGTNYGVAMDGSSTVAGLTVNGNNSIGGIEASGSFNASGNVAFRANKITLSNAAFVGSEANVVLRALNTATPFSVNGSGANFGNVASVLIGGTAQAADLNLAASLTYAGAGNLSVVTGPANIILNGNIDASAGSGSVILSAGNGVPINASQTNGNVTGGDVIVGAATSIAAGEGGTVVIYSGNANSSSFEPLVANGTTSLNEKLCDAREYGKRQYVGGPEPLLPSLLVHPQTANSGTVTVVPPIPTTAITGNPIDGIASSTVLSLGSWLNSGGSQQNIPISTALSDNMMHLLFTRPAAASH